MDEQTQASSQEGQQEQEATTTESPATEPAKTEESTATEVVTEETVPESPPPDETITDAAEATDWQYVAELIATEVEKKQPTYQTVPVRVFGEEVELRIVHEASVGELLVSFLLLLAISMFCLRWLFKVVWGR